MKAGTPLERVCISCEYAVASATASEFSAAIRSFPDECPQCGGSLVPPGQADAGELTPEERERIEEDPVLTVEDYLERSESA